MPFHPVRSAWQKPPVALRQINWAHPLAHRLAHAWLFDEGGGATVRDATYVGDGARPYHGTFGSTVSRAATRGGMGLASAATTSFSTGVTMAPSGGVSAIPAGQVWTWDAILKPTALTDNYGCLLTIANSSGFYLRSIGKISYYQAGDHLSTGTVTTNVWTHVVVTWDGTNLRFYFNGVSDGSTVALASMNAFNISRMLNDDSSDTYIGLIDAMRIWWRVLNPGEIATLYKDPFGMYQSAVRLPFPAVSGPASSGIAGSGGLTFQVPALAGAGSETGLILSKPGFSGTGTFVSASPEARTTQVALTTWGRGTPKAAVTQLTLTVWGTPATPFPGPNGGGIVATGANPIAGDSLCGSETPLLWGELQLDAGAKRYAWVDQPINFSDGQAEPRIVGLSKIRRALSDFSGQIEIGGGTVDLYDADGVIRGLIASNTLIRKRFDLYMIDDAGRRAGTATASRRGMFVVADYEAMADMTVRLTLEDRLGSQSVDATLRKVVPKRTLSSAAFPALPSSLAGSAEPIPYGILETPPTGAVQVWYVGQETLPDGNDYYAGLIAGCATWGVIRTYGATGYKDSTGQLQRVEIPEAFYNTDVCAARHGSLWTTNFGGALYRVLNGRRYTMIYFRVGSTIGENFASDAVPVTVDLGGIEEIGDGTGNVIDDVAKQAQHFWTNFVTQDHATDADWYSIPVDDGYAILSSDSVTAVDTIIAYRLGRGYKGQWVIGHDLKVETVGDWTARIALGGDFSFGINRHGQLIASMEDPNAASVRDFTRNNALTVSGASGGTVASYSVKKDRTLLANVITINTYKNYVRSTNGLTSLPNDLIPSAPGGQTDWLTYRPPFTDGTSVAALGGDPLGQREFHYEDWVFRDPLNQMADSVAAHNLNRRTNGPDIHTFETDLCGLDLELGNVFTITHYAGLVPTTRRVRLTAIELVPPDPFQHTFGVTLIGYDITDLPTNAY